MIVQLTHLQGTFRSYGAGSWVGSRGYKHPAPTELSAFLSCLSSILSVSPCLCG
jgi:hypothetical protein